MGTTSPPGFFLLRRLNLAVGESSRARGAVSSCAADGPAALAADGLAGGGNLFFAISVGGERVDCWCSRRWEQRGRVRFAGAAIALTGRFNRCCCPHARARGARRLFTFLFTIGLAANQQSDPPPAAISVLRFRLRANAWTLVRWPRRSYAVEPLQRRRDRADRGAEAPAYSPSGAAETGMRLRRRRSS
jgi:hypothetical protein